MSWVRAHYGRHRGHSAGMLTLVSDGVLVELRDGGVALEVDFGHVETGIGKVFEILADDCGAIRGDLSSSRCTYGRCPGAPHTCRGIRR